jgi:TonB family protein
MPGAATDLPLETHVPLFTALEAEKPGARHWLEVVAGSLVVHFFLAIGGVWVLRQPPPRFAPVEVSLERRAQQRVTPLVEPPISTLTQRAPNRNELSKEFNLASLPPRPSQPNAPASPGAAAQPKPKFVLPDKPRTGAPAPAIQEAPDLQVRASLPPPAALGTQIPGPPPPPIEPVEKPKIAFERPGVPTGTAPAGTRIPVPRPAASIEEATRQALQRPGGGMVVGDPDVTPGAIPSPQSPSIPGKLGSAVELLSDPQGVDFWPYLVKILSTVRRNWFAVTPESARLGRQGRVVIQFAVARDGTVPKLVIAGPSGTEALDRAAVASISASNPFPPLPPEFRGGQVRLQFVFKYNLR